MGNIKILKVIFATWLFSCPVIGLEEHSDDYHRCLQKSIEKAEEEANVIFTGTIRDLRTDTSHPDMKKAQVEVKRVMKGYNVISALPQEFISRRKTITVDGIANPTICDSYARKYDTRIFLANKGLNGELQLNSSLVRLTLNNIIRADAAVQDTPYKPEPVPPKGKPPCEVKFCAFGATCMESTDGQAECKCLEDCPNIYSPKCGSDGVTYSNECNLRKASCAQKKRIVVKRDGSCDMTDPCENHECTLGAQCVPSLDGLSFRCQCPDRCDSYGDTIDSSPVCGSDGRDYENICFMKKYACHNMLDITVKYTGKCDPCNDYRCKDSQICQLDDNREPMCRCNSLCPLNEFSPVCGTDGRTYSNECIMRVEACKSRREITIQFEGECSTGNNPCDAMMCGPAEDCRVDRRGQATCVCPQPCEEVWRPVCGSDGLTYSSECEMTRQACANRNKITVQYAGKCGKDSPCKDFNCEHDAKCVEINEEAVCQCSRCTEEFDPVCGTDGVTYHNQCKMKVENCETNNDIKIKYKGLCNPCDNVDCDHYSMCEDNGKGIGQCVCPTQCVRVEKEVCGTDGVTYANECELQVSSCEKQQYIIVASQGSCDLCIGIMCKFGGRCENGKCVCPQECGDIIEPVCGSDGNTYSSECEMRAHACKQGYELEVQFPGECEENTGSGSGDQEMCDETTCRFGGVCQFDEEGPVGCTCNFNCAAVRSPVCGSDGRIYGNECQMKDEACIKQHLITESPMDDCEDIDEELCDGNPPLVNLQTGQEYDCDSGRESCPSGSYCHKVGLMSRCCREEQTVRSCADTEFRCCPDGKTAAPGPKNAGCPMLCDCNPLGSLSKTCDPNTMQCDCKPGVGGQKCDRCEPGYWGLPRIAEGRPGCTPCGCDIYGSVRDDCEQMTGRCSCKAGVSGQKCKFCADGSMLGTGGKCLASKKPPQPIHSCDEMTCKFGASCAIVNGEAQCQCSMKCRDLQPVCGSNGQTYGSTCQLRQFVCREQKEISVQHVGACQVEDQPPRRKTTRHINHPTRQPPRYGLVGEMCESDSDCRVKHTYCKSMICTCDDMSTPSDDNKNCLADPCISNPCRNGGTCLSEPPGDYKCVCPLGVDGLLCQVEEIPLTISVTPRTETLLTTTAAIDYLGDFGVESGYTVPSFSGSSYLKLKKLHHVNTDIAIEMEFRTATPDAVLMYAAQDMDGKGDFVSLAVNDGFVEFRYDLGSGPAIIRSATKVQLNAFHKVVAKRRNKEGMVRLDNEDEVAGVSPGALLSLNLQTDIFLGSVDEANEGIHKNIGVRMGLVGCIETLKIYAKDKSHDYELFHPGSSDIVGGAGISECGQNPCITQPCQNGGSCLTIDAEEYECTCRPGFTGKLCEKSELVTGCTPNPCEGGGTCFSVSENDYFCTCPPGREGSNCQMISVSDITVPEFNRDAYIQIPVSRHMGRSFTFEIWFLTKNPTGIILYTSQEDNPKGDFVALMLVNGHVEFRFDLGGGIANITSPTPVQIGRWHKVRITRTNTHGILRLDDEEDVAGHSQGEMKELNVPSYIYIGGYPYQYNPDAGMSVGFNGAVQKVYESDHLIENMILGSLSYSGIKQFNGPPCSDNPCLNSGVCVPDLNDYKCRCKMGFSGHKCENAVSLSDSNLPVKFDGKIHHKYNNKITVKDLTQTKNKFEVKFRTAASNGLLLIVHRSTTVDGDYLAMAICNDQLEVSYNLGKQSLDNLHFIKTGIVVSDNEWHTVTFDRDGRQGTITVDDNTPIQKQSKSGANQLNTNGILWVGGAATVPSGLPEQYFTGFEGCIEKLMIDGQMLNMAESRLDSHNLNYCTDKL